MRSPPEHGRPTATSLDEDSARGDRRACGDLLPGQFPVRPTNDADTVIDVRADLTMLATSTKP